ncbi:hypothetical protein AGMMS4956_09980 [Bacteroidia bacterium]|nr:hypothetical protein AGMMS4956_09980 [Bacteroidia bacterium]
MKTLLTYGNTTQECEVATQEARAIKYKPKPETKAETTARLERLGITFKADGTPNLRTAEEVFTEMGHKMVAHYGEEMRPMLNKSFAKWGIEPI